MCTLLKRRALPDEALEFGQGFRFVCDLQACLQFDIARHLTQGSFPLTMFSFRGRELRPLLDKLIASVLLLRHAGTDALVIDDYSKACIGRGRSTAAPFIIDIGHAIGHDDDKLCSENNSSNRKSHVRLHALVAMSVSFPVRRRTKQQTRTL